ncbi:HTH-type transcriptional repressor KstR2 (plasmid) [Variovorax sp. SRS16]|nr:HTH-type transcriptional repressor KstR2 [Variovorax sp. SRS16]
MQLHRMPATSIGPAALESRESQLLAIARQLFARDGFERTSLRDIAEAADITKAALYYYFPNKEALYERVVVDSMQALFDDVCGAVALVDSPTARIRAFMLASAHVLDHARDRWIAGSRAFHEGGRGGQHLAAIALRDRYESLLRCCIAEGVESGELRAVDPALAGRFLLSGLNQMSHWHRPDGRLSAAQVMAQFLDMALQGLCVEARGNAEASVSDAPVTSSITTPRAQKRRRTVGTTSA